MELSFHERWFRRKAVPVGEMTREVAESRFVNGEPFCVVVRRVGGSCVGFVEVGRGTFGAGFLDDGGKVILDYSFVEEGGRLFLSQVVVVELVGSMSELQTAYYFAPSGDVVIETWTVGSSCATRAVGRSDVTANWQPVPDFEGITELLRRERLRLPAGPEVQPEPKANSSGA